ncbi:nuclear transport factor 2 family protein [Micromonospora sp. NPDC050417]|uniref:nuclear transport factor 2 family protein n=1 Tax=Micromonospora sp. NPDC050417 TaxID=3364280 RepID=UPI00378E7FAA
MSVEEREIVRRVERYYTVVDDNDLGELLDLFTGDATYHRPGYPPLVGRHRLAEFYGAERVIRRGRHTLCSVVADGRRVAVWGEFAGTLNDGSRVELRFADFFVAADDGRFSRRDTFFFAPMV